MDVDSGDPHPELLAIDGLQWSHVLMDVDRKRTKSGTVQLV